MNRQVRKAIFPVGGLGTRFLPATKSMPKEMLPVVDKPLIQYVVEEAWEAGIEECIFVTGRGKSAIEDHFDYSYELHDTLTRKNKKKALSSLSMHVPRPGSIAYIRQQNPQGLGHAVWCARNLIGDEPFAVLLADDLIKSRLYKTKATAVSRCMTQMVNAHKDVGGNMVALSEVPKDQVDKYGVIEPKGAPKGFEDRLIEGQGLVEKPDIDKAPSNLAVIGRYILQPEIFDYLGTQKQGAGGEIQLTDAIARMIGERPFHGYKFAGERFDCGDKTGFIEATIAFALEHPDLDDVEGRVRKLIDGTRK